jgi:hypothetical protein
MPEDDRAFGRIGIETFVERRRKPSRDHRGTREAMVPGDCHAVCHAVRVEAAHVLTVLMVRPLVGSGNLGQAKAAFLARREEALKAPQARKSGLFSLLVA